MSYVMGNQVERLEPLVNTFLAIQNEHRFCRGFEYYDDEDREYDEIGNMFLHSNKKCYELCLEIIPCFKIKRMSLYKLCREWELGGGEFILYFKEWDCRLSVNVHRQFKPLIQIHQILSRSQRQVHVQIIREICSVEVVLYDACLYYDMINPRWFLENPNQKYHCSYTLLEVFTTKRKFLVPFGKCADQARVEFGFLEFEIEMFWQETPIRT